MTDFEVGLYRLDINDKTTFGWKPDNQDHMGEYHTDGYEFYYYNGDHNWVDIGWGSPFDWDELKLVPMTEKYRELAEFESVYRQHHNQDQVLTVRGVANEAKEWREYGL